MASKTTQHVSSKTSYTCNKCGYEVKAEKETTVEKAKAETQASKCYDSHATLDSSCKVYSATYGPFGRYPKEVEIDFKYNNKVARVKYKIDSVKEVSASTG